MEGIPPPPPSPPPAHQDEPASAAIAEVPPAPAPAPAPVPAPAVAAPVIAFAPGAGMLGPPIPILAGGEPAHDLYAPKKYCHSCWEEVTEPDCIEAPRSYHRACAICCMCEEQLPPKAQPSREFAFLVCEKCTPNGHFYMAMNSIRRLIADQEIYLNYEKARAERIAAGKTEPAQEATPIAIPGMPHAFFPTGLKPRRPQPMSLFLAVHHLKEFLTNLHKLKQHPIEDNAKHVRQRTVDRARKGIRALCIQLRDLALDMERNPPRPPTPPPPPKNENPPPPAASADNNNAAVPGAPLPPQIPNLIWSDDESDGDDPGYAGGDNLPRKRPQPPPVLPSEVVDLCTEILRETQPERRAAHMIVIDSTATDFVQSVPVDVSRYILSMLDRISLCGCRAVSKRWRLVSDDEYVWEKLYRSQIGREKPFGYTWRQSYIRAWTSLAELMDEHRMTRVMPYNRAPQVLPPRPAQPMEFIQNVDLPRGFPAHPASSAEPVLRFALNLADEQAAYFEFEANCRRSPVAPVLRQDEVAEAMLLRYYRFMTLKSKHPDVLLIPTEDIEMVWITHLTRPQQYIFDCKKEFGSVIAHQLRAQLYQHAFFWEALATTVRLWKEAYSCDYLIREVDCVAEAKKQDQERKHAAREGFPVQNILHQPPFFVHFAHRGNLMGEIRAGNPSEDSILAFAQLQRDPNWECPLQISKVDIVRDRDWYPFVERYQREASLRLRNPNVPLGSSDGAAATPATHPLHPQPAQFSLRDETFRKAALKMYEKWLYLQARHPSIALETTYVVDLSHRAHMCNPHAYQEDSVKLFNKVISRRPWPGQSAMDAYLETLHLWKEEFGVDMEIDFMFSAVNDPNAKSPYENTKHEALNKLTRNYIAAVYAPEVKQTRIATIEDALKHGVCTFVATGMMFANQEYFKCRSCPMQPDEGVCHTCAKTCHAGHKLELQPVARFYCDCGSSYACKALPM